jgi:hypothetical protein
MSSLVTHHLGTFWASRPNKTQQDAETTTLQTTSFRHTLESQSPSDPVMRNAVTAGTDTIHTLAYSIATTDAEHTKACPATTTTTTTTKGHCPALGTPSAGRHHPVAVCLCRTQIHSGFRTGHHIYTRVDRRHLGRTVLVLMGHMRLPGRR